MLNFFQYNPIILMKKRLLLLICTLIFSSILLAFSDGEREILYYTQEKQEWQALSLSLFVPIMGHIYAEQPERSMPMVTTQFGGILLMVSGSSALQSDPDTATGRIVFGGVIFMTGKLWELFDVWNAVGDFNNALMQKYEIILSMSPNSSGPALTATFPL
jgi:hypothetical protein